MRMSRILGRGRDGLPVRACHPLADGLLGGVRPGIDGTNGPYSCHGSGGSSSVQNPPVSFHDCKTGRFLGLPLGTCPHPEIVKWGKQFGGCEI